jgi:hypothetical protein
MDGGAILSDARPSRRTSPVLALESAQGVHERAGCGAPALTEGVERRFVHVLWPGGPLEVRPCRPLPRVGLTHRIFTLFTEWVHLVQADPPWRRNLPSDQTRL